MTPDCEKWSPTNSRGTVADPAFRESLRTNVRAQRLGRGDEAAAVPWWLASPDASSLFGAVIPTDVVRPCRLAVIKPSRFPAPQFDGFAILRLHGETEPHDVGGAGC